MAPQAQQQAKNLRRSLPAGPSLKHGRDESSVPPLATPSGWSDLTNPIRQTAEGLSAMRQRAADEPASRGAGHRLPTDSVQLEDAIALSQAALEHQRQAHGAPAAMQPSAMHASSHPADDSRSQSRQAQRAQTATPREMQVAAGAFQSQPAAEAPSMSNANSGSHYRTTALNVNDAPIFSNYSNYPDTLATASNDRIGYEPYSYHKSSSNNHGQNGATYSSYDYGRTSTASTVSMEDAAMTTMASAYPANSLSVADPLSSSRGHNNSPGRASLPYDPPDARRRPSQLSTSSQDFGGMRSAPQQAARPSHGQHQQHQKHQQHQQSSHQQQSHQRSSHHHQQPHQQPSQGQNWYSFSNNPNSTSYAFGVPRPNYNWKLPDESWGGMS
ncbi:hypothetical protein CDD83_5967 [Cordyceps sp. RAO-2017]|nr:hypothetical protein CDD83_5967 [Cordyceps sp. RAO-2017]